MTTRLTRNLLGVGGTLFTLAAAPAFALTTTPDTDAFVLAAALAPGAGLTVSGDFVEVGPAAAGTGAIGTFVDAMDSLGFDAGVVLSTGDVAGIFAGATPTTGTDFGWVPSTDTAQLLDGAPGAGSGYFDAVRFSVTIDPGFDADFVNFDFAYATNEAGLTTDRFGLYVDGIYFGLLGGLPVDQAHPWVDVAGAGFGFDSVLYPDGDPLAFPLVTVSLAVPSPASPFTLDFVLADVTDGTIDTAVFLGNLRGSTAPLGVLAAPVPVPAALPLLAAALLPAGLLARRRA